MLIRNLILGPPTKRDDGETVLIQDYGLTAYVGWNPSRMEQRNGRIDRKLPNNSSSVSTRLPRM